MRVNGWISAIYAPFKGCTIRQMWESIKTFVGIWSPPNKTSMGKGKTFVGSPHVCGAERRRSRSEAAADMLRNAKRAESA